MKFWNRRNKIEFFHNEPSIIDNFPVIESKDLKLNWTKKAREDFENHLKVGFGAKTPYFTHLVRCPGIFDLFKYGYIIPLHKDVMIIPEGDTKFKWFSRPGRHSNTTSSADPRQQDNFRITAVPESVVNLLPKPSWVKNFIVKIDTGWNVIAPKGIKFITLPIAYPDTFNFTTSTGILNPAISTQVNFQLFWSGAPEETLLKAGTPLAQLIPLTEKKYQMVQRIMNKKDSEWILKLDSMSDSTFWAHSVRNKVADMYTKYWN